MNKKETRIQKALGIKQTWFVCDGNYNIGTIQAYDKEEALQLVIKCLKKEDVNPDIIARISVKMRAPKDPTDNFLRYLKKQIDKGKKEEKK